MHLMNIAKHNNNHTIAADRTAEYELKLMDIDSEHLGIPDTPYNANITLPSSEFARICRDLSVLNESGRLPCYFF